MLRGEARPPRSAGGAATVDLPPGEGSPCAPRPLVRRHGLGMVATREKGAGGGSTSRHDIVVVVFSRAWSWWCGSRGRRRGHDCRWPRCGAAGLEAPGCVAA
jgi:hypothetical protein